MPNYGLVVTPQYNPMSYEQYAKPFEDYAKVYNQMADAYDALEMEANQWEKLATDSKNAPYYKIYKQYANDLRSAASDLADNGLSMKTRGALSRLRKRYANEIKPIADAYTRTQELIDEQRKLNPNGTKLFDIDYSKEGIGRVYNDPTSSYRTIDLPTVTNEVANVMSNYKKVLMNSGDWGKTQVSGLLERIEQYGLLPEDLDAISNPNNPNYNNPLYQQIRNVVDNAYIQTGVDSWSDAAKKQAVYKAAFQGVPYGLGTSEVKNVEDPWNQYYIWKKQKEYEASQPTPDAGERLWDFVGDAITIAQDMPDLQEQAEDLRIMNNLVKTGKIPEAPQSTKYGMLNPVEGLYREEQYPEYYTYDRISKKYKTSDLTTLRDMLAADYQKNVLERAAIERWTTLNSATNNRLVNWIDRELTSGRDDEKLGKDVKDSKNKSIGTKEVANLREALTDSDTSLQINFNTGKVRLHNPKHGDYYIPSTVFSNLNLLLGTNIVKGNEFIDEAVKFYSSDLDNDTKEDTMKKIIGNFYTGATAYIRTMTQEPGDTNAHLQISQ